MDVWYGMVCMYVYICTYYISTLYTHIYTYTYSQYGMGLSQNWQINHKISASSMVRMMINHDSNHWTLEIFCRSSHVFFSQSDRVRFADIVLELTFMCCKYV